MNLPVPLTQFDVPLLQRVHWKIKGQARQRLKWVDSDLNYSLFAAEHLRIRTKSGAIAPLIFNRAQRYIHEKLEAQRAATGKVRALILKGRQQGCSTYIAGRFYHCVTRHRGMRVFILTHEDQATQNLFEIVTRFHDHWDRRPSTGASDAKELYFDKLDSGYQVGTAGHQGVRRPPAGPL